MPALQLFLLGQLDIRYDDQPLPKPPTLKSQSLLAYLISYRNQPHLRERLAGLFWADRPEPRARHSLATALWHIRRYLPHEEYILGDSHTVQFDPRSDLWLDVDEFESEIEHHDVTCLESAVALYRGDFLEGFYDDWILNERYRLEVLFADALARLMADYEVRGEHKAALSTAQRLLHHDPLREDAHRLVMRACCHLGQRNAALEQYHRCRKMVGEELGAEPMVETTKLYHAIVEGGFAIGHPVSVIPLGKADTLWPRPSGRNPLDAIAPTGLVGRARELEFLEDCWQRTGSSPGSLVLILGEAGVGKTRLVEEFANHLRWRGARVLWGRCYEFERLLPYQPVSEALRTLLPSLTPAELANLDPWVVAEVSRLMPEIAELYTGPQAPATTDTTQEQTHLFDGVVSFLGYLSAQQALLLVVEDLHWASACTLQMLHYLVRQLALADRKVLLVGTARPEMLGRQHPLRALERQLSREGLAQCIHLPHLSPEAVELMVVEMSGAGTMVVPLARRLYRETEGNPFFLMEIVKALFGADMVQFEGGVWKGDFSQISEGVLLLPASLSEAILARVDSLADDTREVLCQASVLGREFDFDLVNALWERGGEATLEALDDLLRHRLVEEGSGAVGRDYAFSHHKIQEVVYAGLPRRRRQHAHARAGAAMERLYDAAEREALSGELAFHFEQAQALDKTLAGKAVIYLLQAGDRARGLYAHREAIDYYRRALALLREQGDYEQAARTVMKLGLTHHNAFDFRQAQEAYKEGFVLWQRAGELQPVTLPPAPHALRLCWPEPTTLDPACSDTQFTKVLMDQLFSGLVELSPDMEVLPDVAHSWEVLDGGCKYLFHLRDDVVWTDGLPVTAYDFEYAWRRALHPATGSSVADLLCDIKGARSFRQGQLSDLDRLGIKALDEGTLLVELEAPLGYFLYLLANCANWPAPRHLIQQLGQAWTEPDNLVTNGAFQLLVWQPGVSMILSRNPSYHGRFGGNVHRIELILLPHSETRAAVNMYEADELDALTLWLPPPKGTDPALQSHPGEYVRVPRLSSSYVVFDSRRWPFSDVRVRRALVLATERETLAGSVLGGYESPATGGFLPPGMPGHSPRIGLPFDPGQARRLLAEAGYPNGCGFPAVAAVAARARLPYVGYLQTAWREHLGVDISWKLVDALPEDVLRNESPELFAGGWLADYPDPDDFLRISTVPSCLGWQNEAVEGLVAEAQRVMDQGQRMKLYGQAERILIEEARIMPLTYGVSHLLVKPWVRGYPRSALGAHSWKDIIVPPHF